MSRLISGRNLLALGLMACAVLLLPLAAHAQTGAVSGKVVDVSNKPLEKAVIQIEFMDGINRRYEVKTNKKGEFIQIGLGPGSYKLTAKYEGLGQQEQTVRVRLGDPTKVDFILGAGGGGVATKEDAARAVALKTLFDEGVTLSRAGNYDGAIAKFTEAATVSEQIGAKPAEAGKPAEAAKPVCFDCYYNIGFNYGQKKDYDKAEAAFLKAIEIRPTYSDAYNGLATVYNAQKKFDKAQEMSQKAAELAASAAPGSAGGSGAVDAEYNQGVILWNAGKIPEAAEHFQKVLFLKPDHADAHYQMGMALLNQNKLAEALPMFEKYLELAPEGQYAATAKGILASIKK
jgi:tetratricopeptide (TPR) repeat protein